MALTREEAIKKTRNMWNWIADKTLERKTIVSKLDYFEENGIKDIPRNNCYLCEYSMQFCEDYEYWSKCTHCPLKFTKENMIYACEKIGSPYLKWFVLYGNPKKHVFGYYELASQYAKEIANLTEK